MARIRSDIARFVGVAIFVVLAASCASPRPGEADSQSAAALALERFEYRRVCLGCDARIVIYAPDEAVAREAARAAFGRIDAIDAIASDYRVDSEIARLADHAGGEAVVVSRELVVMLSLALELSARTDGAYDVTAAPVTRLWRDAIRSGTVPDPQALAAARRLVDWRAIELDEAARAVRLMRTGMRLDLGSIAKGYAADEALRELATRGVSCALVDLGGDIVVGASPPGRHAWLVHVADSDATIDLVDAAVATSGALHQGVDMPQGRLSHLVDPRSDEAVV